jgi:uncharacterized oligopeptide transporter (OPT) family protein
VVGLVFTFGSSHPGAQVLAITLASTFFAMAHEAAAPLASRDAQRLQTVLLICLVGVALAAAPRAVLLQVGFVGDTPPHSTAQ